MHIIVKMHIHSKQGICVLKTIFKKKCILNFFQCSFIVGTILLTVTQRFPFSYYQYYFLSTTFYIDGAPKHSTHEWFKQSQNWSGKNKYVIV